MDVRILLSLLGMPMRLLPELPYHQAREFSERIDFRPFQDLFINTFFKSLDRHGKPFNNEVTKLKKSITRKKKEFVKTFSSRVTDYISFVSALGEETFPEGIAQEIIKQFQVQELQNVMPLIVSDCLKEYRGEFLKNMIEKHSLQLKLLFKGQIPGILSDVLKDYEEDLISELKRIVGNESPNGKGDSESKRRGKQVKILSITASPEDAVLIDYESEQDLMLEAFREFERDEVFLDMPDPVNSTLAEIESHLEDGRHDILHITAHGGIDENGKGFLLLEDEWGKSLEVSGDILVKSLVPPPRIVILTASHSAQAVPGLMPAAQAIFKAGIDVVIGMSKAVSHYAAMEFNVAFFKALCQGKNVSEAFNEGKVAILAGEKQRMQDMPGWNFLNEAEIPQLLVRDKDTGLSREDFSDHIIAAPGRPRSHHFMGAMYLERGFIGRRNILRDIYRRIREREGAVVLKGPGGIGKSTLATRMAANLRLDGYEFIVIQGETSPELIIEAISKHAVQAGIKEAEQVYTAQADAEAKLAWFLENFLLKRKVLIIFDNFEENQEEESGEFLSKRLQGFLDYFREALKHKDSFLFFSTRYRLPGYAGLGITLDIPELSDVEFRKLLQNSAALKRLDGKSVENLRREVGGNPRGLELLDNIAYEEFHRREFSWEQLKDLMPELQRRIIEKHEPGDDFTPLYLGRLLGYLTETQAMVLEILAVYRVAVPEAAIEVHGVSMARQDRLKLSALSLLEIRETEKERLYYVHRLTAQYLLGKIEKTAVLKYHLQAAQYFEGLRTEGGEVYPEDFIEARWHFIQAGEWNRAADITFALEDYLTLHGFPFWSMELLQELEIDKLDEKHRLITYGQMGTLYQGFGNYDTAIEFYNKAYELAQNTNDLKNSSSVLHQIGMIYQYRGDYEEALKHYQQGLEIADKIGDIKGFSESLHLIGRIYKEKGDYEEALKYYQQSLELAEKISDVKSVALSFHQIGMIYEEKGEYEQALKQYQRSLEMAEKIGDIKGVSESFIQIGMIYQYKGEYEQALKQYRQSLEILEKIGDSKGISTSLHQIGIIYQLKGEYEEALKHYRQSLEIREKIGDIKGISESLHQIGMIYEDKGEYEEALKYYQQSLEIEEKIGDINGVAKSLHQIGRIYQDKGEYEAALKQYQKSLEIKEKIGDISGVAISMHQLGKLYFEKNEFATALRFFIQAFLIFHKIGSPNAKKAAQGIAMIREKLPPEEFEGILKEIGVEL